MPYGLKRYGAKRRDIGDNTLTTNTTRTALTNGPHIKTKNINKSIFRSIL